MDRLRNVPAAVRRRAFDEYGISYADGGGEAEKPSSNRAVLSVPAATLCSSDGSEEEDDGEGSEELDSADTGPSGECLTKRGAPVTTSGGGREEKKKLEFE